MSRTVITPPGRLNLPDLRELWSSREVLYRFGVRDVVLRYRQTFIGVSWVLIQPLAAAGIFSIVFGQVANLSTGGTPYFVFSFAGMLIWNLFAGIVGRATPSLVANQGLVSKVFFPRMLVPLSSVLSVLLDFVVASALFAVLLVVYGIELGWQVLLVPVWVLVAVLLASGLGLAGSAITVKYRDVNYAMPWLIQVMLFATPIAYSLDSVPDNLLWLFNLNPLTWLLECFRWSALGLDMPALWQVVGVLVAGPVVFLLGTLVFQRFERQFADVI